MRLSVAVQNTVVLAAAVLLLAAGAGAQEAGAPPPTLSLDGMLPSAVVARLARQAMHAPGDSAAWAALAHALPEMALVEGADLEGTFEAARMADSMSAAAMTAPGAREDAPLASGTSTAPAQTASRVTAGVAAIRERIDGFPRLPVPLALGAVLALSSLLGVLVFRRTRGARTSPATRAHASGGRTWAAAALASGGIATADIARRTGLAQEGVDLVLRLANASAAASRPTRSTSRSGSARPVAPRTTLPSERLRQEVRQGVGRLRDQRLTYGGMASHESR